MPLSDAQKDFIKTGITYLFDFSTPEEFRKKEPGLHKAMTGPVSKDHEFYWLREFWLNPTNYFQTLEKQGPIVTIGEVQEYILDLVLESIPKQAARLRWDRKKLLNTSAFPEENWATPFVSQKARVENDDAWQLPPLNGKIYTQQIQIISEEEILNFEEGPVILNTDKAYVNVTLHLGAHLQKSVELRDVPPSFNNDAEADRVIETIKTKAQAEAKKSAAESAISYLARKFKIGNHTRAARNSAAAKEVITTQYYFDLLNSNQLRFSAVAYLSAPEAENLTHPSIIECLRNNLCTFDEAKNLTPAERKIISHPTYFSLLMKHHLTINDIKKTTERRAKFLTHPHITNLIQTNKINFAQAKRMPFHLCELLTKSLYIDFFRRNEVNWSDVNRINEEQTRLLLNNNFSRLITKKIIGFNDVAAISNEFISFLEQHPEFISWVEKNVLDWKDICPYNPEKIYDVYVKAYSQRLYAVFNGHACFLNQHTDDANSLLEEFQSVAEKFDWQIELFHEWIIYSFVCQIEADINTKIASLSPHDSDAVAYNRFLQHIEANTQGEKTDWFLILSNLILLAKQALIQISRKQFLEEPKQIPVASQRNTLHFNASTSKKRERSDTDEDLKVFCHSLTTLEKLTVNPKLGVERNYYF